MKARALLWGVVAAAPLLVAAWPDTYPSRRAAIAAFQYDMIADVRHDADIVAEKYQYACKKGFAAACDTSPWTGPEGADPAKVDAFFSKRCGGEPLACVVAGWAKSRVNDRISSEARDPAGAARMFRTSCKKDLYAPACTAIGELALEGIGTPQSDTEAFAFIKEGCEGEDWYGCFRLGDLYRTGHGAPASTEEAAKSYRIGCDHEVTEACAALGALAEIGDGTPRDLARAGELYGRACKERYMTACYDLGRLYVEGKGVKGSPLVAMGLFQSVCDLGDLRGCYGVGTLYEDGRGVTVDVARAQTLYDAACEAGHAPACSRLGAMYLSGKSVEKDVDLGLRYVQRGCRAGDLEGCVEVGRMYEEGHRPIEMNLTRAVDLYKQACEGGGGEGCYRLGTLYDLGKGVPPNQGQAMTLYRQSCELEYGASCGVLAIKFRDGEGVPRSSRESLRYLGRACDNLHGSSCALLGEHYESGDGVEQDIARAVSLFKIACNQEDARGCFRLGTAYQSGSGIEQNFFLALRSYEVACKLDVKEACQAAEPITLQARFEGVVHDAFSSSVCEVWGFDSQEPDRNRLLVEVQGDRMAVGAGPYAGKSLKIRHLRNSYLEERVYTAQSFWSLQDNDQVILTDIEHHEVWRSDRDDVDAFPGDESFSRDPKGSASLLYSRDQETIRRNQESRCTFVEGYQMLTSEQCSEVQALMAAQVVSDCR